MTWKTMLTKLLDELDTVWKLIELNLAVLAERGDPEQVEELYGFLGENEELLSVLLGELEDEAGPSPDITASEQADLRDALRDASRR